MQLRNESVLPMWRKSRIDTDEPKRAKPSTVSVLLTRAKFRNETELPI
jgi:hypothetical protein